MVQKCPKCNLINSPTAVTCDCGWDFAAARLSPVASQAESEKAARYARNGWLLPLIAWLSQIIAGLTLRGVRGLGLLWLVLMVTQFVLIIAGLYFGLKALAIGRPSLSQGQWRAAILGVTLSGGTILLIVGVAAFASR